MLNEGNIYFNNFKILNFFNLKNKKYKIFFFTTSRLELREKCKKRDLTTFTVVSYYNKHRAIVYFFISIIYLYCYECHKHVQYQPGTRNS